jgi:hypothetical protein
MAVRPAQSALVARMVRRDRAPKWQIMESPFA